MEEMDSLFVCFFSSQNGRILSRGSRTGGKVYNRISCGIGLGIYFSRQISEIWEIWVIVGNGAAHSGM